MSGASNEVVEVNMLIDVIATRILVTKSVPIFFFPFLC